MENRGIEITRFAPTVKRVPKTVFDSKTKVLPAELTVHRGIDPDVRRRHQPRSTPRERDSGDFAIGIDGTEVRPGILTRRGIFSCLGVNSAHRPFSEGQRNPSVGPGAFTKTDNVIRNSIDSSQRVGMNAG